MRNKTIIRSAAILLALLVTEAAQARIFEFNGTRQQVRAACKGAGAHLNEGPSYTSCGKGSSGVICYDGGKCLSSGARRAADGVRPKVIPQVPKSLVESGGDNGSSVAAPTVPAPAPSAPPIFN